MSALEDWLGIAVAQPSWKGTFGDYFPMVLEDPKLARSAHALLYDAVVSSGVTRPVQDEDVPTYGVFNSTIFGIDEVLHELVQVLQAGSQGLDIRRRIVLLMGPPGSAKSTIVTLLKRRLEEYTATDEGAVYAIAGCPLHEDPLHLLPPAARDRLFQHKGIRVEGELCPVCAHRLEHDWRANLQQVPVERIVLSETRRTGIATFAPSDPNVQDVSDLVGAMDLLGVQRHGSESHPEAWRFDGTLDAANRGICELIELLKAKAELQYVLLTLAQERQIKTGRFALISADEVLLAHSNEAEYRRFAGDQKNEALQNRTYIIRVPYNLRWSDEERIYGKLVSESRAKGHMAPWTLRAAAGWALLSRYEAHDKWPAVLQLKLYDGQLEGEYTEASVAEMKEALPNNGMSGISPRQVIDALSQALVGASVPCLTPTEALRALRQSLEHHILNPQERTRTDALVEGIVAIRKEYDDWAKRTVSKAFIAAFDEAAHSLVARYLDMAEASLRKDKVRDPVTGELVEPDEKLLCSLEDLIGVGDANRKSFREELMVRVAGCLRRGEKFRYDSHPRFKEAVERRLFADMQNVLRTTVSAKVPDEDQRKRLAEVKDRLIENEGFCPHCADAILEYVGYLLDRA